MFKRNVLKRVLGEVQRLENAIKKRSIRVKKKTLSFLGKMSNF